MSEFETLIPKAKKAKLDKKSNESFNYTDSYSIKENDISIPVDLNQSAELFDDDATDGSFETFVAGLSEEVMNGSQPLPNEVNALSQESKLAKLGLKIQEIPEVLETIFSCLPGSDMLYRCTQVCYSWNNLIKHEQFMPWKKLYLKIRNHDKDAYDYVKALYMSVLSEDQNNGNQWVKSAEAIATIIRFVYFSKSTSAVSRDDEKTMTSLSRHCLCSFAMEVIHKRIVTSACKTNDRVCGWMLAATIACLSASSSHLAELRRCLFQVHSHHVVMDFFYLVAASAWLMYKEKLLNLELHHRIFCSISSVENTTYPKPTKNNENPGLRLTYEQSRVAGHSFCGGEVVRVVAYAGTGKTTTLGACVGANPDKTFLYTSFAKAVVVQGNEMFSCYPNVTCRTLHSLAYRGMGMKNDVEEKFKFVVIRYAHTYKDTTNTTSQFSLKCYPKKLSRASFRSSDVREKLNLPEDDKQLPSLIIRCVNKFLASSDPGITLRHVPMKQRKADGEYEDIDSRRRKRISLLAKVFYQNTCDLTNEDWKMTDDCYLKQWQLTQPIIDNYDVIMLDEAQDCTDCMRGILERQRNHCVLLLVGDSHQQIYGFRYASDALVTIPPTHSYYLTQSFRFGEEIAQVADCILRAFKFDPVARINRPHVVADKTLLGVGHSGTVSGRETEGQVATLCRSNFGVIKQVLASLKADPKRKVSVVGGAAKLGLDLLMDLFALTKPIHERTGRFTVKRRHLQRYTTLQKLKEEATVTEDDEMLAKITIVKELGSNLPHAVETLRGLPDHLSEADHVVSTVHKAKGLEFETVVICDDFASNLVQKLRSGLQLQRFDEGEANLLYVAATRAKKSLVMSPILIKLLQLCKIHFLRALPTSSLLHSEKQAFCAVCKNILLPQSVVTLYQPGISKMQEEGPLCPSCASSLSPGWTHLTCKL